MRKTIMFGAGLVSTVLISLHVGAQPLYEAQFIFDPEVEDHGHVHASCIVECPNGELRAVWYENGTLLPPPYYSERRDKSDDVRIGGSRKAKGADAWEKPFVMADTPDFPDTNCCMIIDPQERLWLLWPTIQANTWESALMK